MIGGDEQPNPATTSAEIGFRAGSIPTSLLGRTNVADLKFVCSYTPPTARPLRVSRFQEMFVSPVRSHSPKTFLTHDPDAEKWKVPTPNRQGASRSAHCVVFDVAFPKIKSFSGRYQTTPSAGK